MNPSPRLPSEVLVERTDTAPPAVVRPAAPGLATPIGGLYRLWRASNPPRFEGGPLAVRPIPSLARARARRMRQGARRVFFWALGFYAAAQLALVVALGYWHPTLTESWKSHKWEQLRRLQESEPDRPLLLMLGSSRTDDAFHASRLNGLPGPGGKPWVAYNFGVPMVGPLRENLYLAQLLEAGIRPRLLLVEFLPIFLNESHKHFISEENWAVPHFMTLPELLHLWPYLDHPRQIGRHWLEARLAPWYAMRSDLCRLAKQNLCDEKNRSPVVEEAGWNFWKHDDWGFRQPRPFGIEEHLRGWMGTHGTFFPTLQGLRVGSGPLRAIRDLLDRCRREGIPVVLVFMPESAQFRSWYCPQGLAEARRLFQELSREYGADAIDASDWVADIDFRDGHHVQGKGAHVFTTRLIEELRPILARLGEASPAVAAAAPKE